MDGIRRIVQGLREASREAHARTDLTAAQVFVLKCLADGEALSVNELADRTFTHQSSVSTVVSRLVKRRLIQRRRDPDDGRRRILVLTKTGHTALSAAPHPAQERLISAVQALPRPTRRSLARALGHMADAMAAKRHAAMFFEEQDGKGETSGDHHHRGTS